MRRGRTIPSAGCAAKRRLITRPPERRYDEKTTAFELWLDSLQRDFGDRLLPVSLTVADAWGLLNAPAPLPVVDSLLAATALAHGLVFVTRDTSKLEGAGVPLLNPWEPA